MENSPFIPTAENALDYFNRLAVADKTIALLRKQLASAELLSAANLGVLPVVFARSAAIGSGDILAQYGALEGAARTAFFQKHKDAIWAAKEATTGTVE